MPPRYDRTVRLVDESGNLINTGNPLPVTGGGSGGGGTSQADKSSFTPGTSLVTPVGGFYTTDPGTDPPDNTEVGIRSTIKRALHINLRTDGGAEIGIASAPVRTDPTGSTAQPITDGGGSVTTDSVDGGHATLGTTTDPDTADTVIGRLKQIVARLASVLTVAGNKTNNGAAPGATNVGVLPAVATAADPAYTEGRQVGLSVGLDGRLRTDAAGSSVITDIEDGTGDSIMDPALNAAQVKLVSAPDGVDAAQGATTDLDTANTVIGRLKKIVSLLTGSLTVIVSGTPTVNQGTSPWVVGDGGGAITTDSADGAHVTLGTTTDLDTANTVIGRLKKIVALLTAALTVNQGTSPWIVGDGGASLSTDSVDGAHASIGATTDADTDLTVIGRLKKLVSLFAGGLPAALVGGRLDVNVGAGSIGVSGFTGFVSSINSTTSNLTNGATFPASPGAGDDVRDYAAVTLNIRASHVSAADGVSIEWSSDNSNFDQVEKYTYRSALQGFSVTVRPKARYYRLVYTNGGTTTTTLRIQSILHPVAPFDDSPQINGRVIVDGISYPIKQAAINATAAGDNTVLSAVTSRRLRILFMMHTGDEAYQATYKSGASNTLVNAMAFANMGGPGVSAMPFGFLMETNVGEAFVINLDDAANVRGVVNYVELP